MAHAADHDDALPQLLGEFAPVDVWQRHMNTIVHGVRGGAGDLSQTFASADHRLGYALAEDYTARARRRLRPAAPPSGPLTIMEWGCGSGHLAACFLDRVQALDHDAALWPRIRYVLVDTSAGALDRARGNAGLAKHRDRVQFVQASADNLLEHPDGSVDRIFCNELWSELPTKLLLRNAGGVLEEHIRPNLKATRLGDFPDWAALCRLFAAADTAGLARLPGVLDDLVWEREYRAISAKDLPFRRLITDSVQRFDDEVLVPVNTGAAASLTEARRLLAPDALGLSAFDAGAADRAVLNDPGKPCVNIVGGQWSFLVNLVFLQDAAGHVGGGRVTIEPQRAFVGACLGADVAGVMDVLASHPDLPDEPWAMDLLLLRTVNAVNAVYTSPYARAMTVPAAPGAPDDARRELAGLLAAHTGRGIAATAAYLTEDELLAAIPRLEPLGYTRHALQAVLTAPPRPVDYYHFHMAPAP